MKNYIIKPLGEMYMEEVTADDIRLALVPLTKKSEGLYSTVNMLIKCVFYAAERNQILEHNPCVGISGKGGKPGKKREALTDQQVAVLLDTVKGLPPYLFIMIGLYSGLRREEILALQWDCVFLDESTPYISVRRAWRTEHNRPVISTVLKTKAAKRDIPIPKCLVDCLREAKDNSISDYVIADSKGEPLAASQFQRVWQYVVVRSTKPRNYYKYVNGQSIKYTVTPTLGMTQKNQPKIKYTLDFDVTPHQLRHTYITNLLYAGVDPKTVQYLAGHENSKTTMDIYKEILGLIEEIIFRNYLDETSENLSSEIDSFPDIRYFTGNYYVVYERYGFTYWDHKHRPYHIKNGQYRSVWYKGNERQENYLPLDSDEITKYYNIFIQVGLTGIESGQEEDYMSLDLVAEIASLDDKIEFEVLSHGVM